jgi:hypothetical protein
MASRELALTIDEAVLVLNPPITCQQLASLIAALDIRPVGKRREHRRGRPRLTYDLAELQRLHAAIVPWLRPHRPDEPATALVATRRPDGEWGAGIGEAASASPVGGTSASAYVPGNGPRAGLPRAKMRVYELAKEFGVPSKVVMARLQGMGEFSRSAAALVPPDLVRQLRAEFSAKRATGVNEGQQRSAAE